MDDAAKNRSIQVCRRNNGDIVEQSYSGSTCSRNNLRVASERTEGRRTALLRGMDADAFG